MTDTVIRVEGLGKRYRIGARQTAAKSRGHAMARYAGAPFRYLREALTAPTDEEILWALKDVSFQVQRGEVVGIIGRNGAGKSTLLKILSRITEPTEGEAEIHGRVSSLLEVGTGFHPELTGRENVRLNGAILGMKGGEIARKFDEIVEFAELGKFIDTPVKRYSSGMYVRLAFAVAAHLEPEVVLVDEVLAVGDARFQKKCLGKIGDVTRLGRTVLFVSHNMASMLNLCSRGVLLDAGRVAAVGPIDAVVNQYMALNTSITGEAVLEQSEPDRDPDFRLCLVRILGEDGRPTAHVDLSHGCRIEIEYDVTAPIRGSQIVFELWNSMGVCVLCSTDLDDGATPAAEYVRQPGRYSASCFVEPRYLRPGGYWIDVSASVPGMRKLGEARNAINFEVTGKESVETRLSQGRRGVLCPILHWETRKV
jgi:lipopolysaccharide transport system ATP-binding protein